MVFSPRLGHTLNCAFLTFFGPSRTPVPTNKLSPRGMLIKPAEGRFHRGAILYVKTFHRHGRSPARHVSVTFRLCIPLAVSCLTSSREISIIYKRNKYREFHREWQTTTGRSFTAEMTLRYPRAGGKRDASSVSSADTFPHRGRLREAWR